MKFLVLGAGKMGYAVAYDLIRGSKVEKVVVADSSTDNLKELVKRLPDEKIIPVELDVTNEEELAQLMAEIDVAVSCITYKHNYELAKIALATKTHFVDLGGNEEIVAKEFMLDELAKEQGVTIIPDLGLAPGLVSLLAVSAAESFDEIYDIRLRVGGLPANPDECFMDYCQVFSIDGLINEYNEDCTVLRDGKIFSVPSLSDNESIEFPRPFGTMEAFNTSGGISTLPKSYLGRVQHLDYKTIRYPGHCDAIHMLKELGLMSKEAVETASGPVVPRDLLFKLLSDKLPKDEPDVVLVRVMVSGLKDKKPVQIIWDCIDYADQAAGLTAMMRMTAFPASIVAQMIARGDITERGVLRQETTVPTKLFLAEMDGRGIRLQMTERAPAHIK
ncbi:saccharopine dehydrogenase NADP-binding domain-containing protein [bacterium]|nr:saccharopine dehydrogenase NADP-binding domain-containing protein [bacterium]MBP9808742.1 saccharopine dehydrogenase NADP-binding domain-containing protein [bacterium]